MPATIDREFYIAVSMAVLGFIAVLVIEWLSREKT
jgi:uncharacterized membrane protein